VATGFDARDVLITSRSQKALSAVFRALVPTGAAAGRVAHLYRCAGGRPGSGPAAGAGGLLPQYLPKGTDLNS
jgi:hypothetical protein